MKSTQRQSQPIASPRERTYVLRRMRKGESREDARIGAGMDMTWESINRMIRPVTSPRTSQ